MAERPRLLWFSFACGMSILSSPRNHIVDVTLKNYSDPNAYRFEGLLYKKPSVPLAKMNSPLEIFNFEQRERLKIV